MNQQLSQSSKTEGKRSTKIGIQRSVVLPQEMWDELYRRADEHQCSVSQVIRNTLRKALDQTPDVV